MSGNDHRVQRFSGLNGSFINTFAASGGLGLPIGIIYGPDANLYVASFNGHRVVRFESLTGANLGDFVTNGSGGLSGPNFMVFRPPVAPATSTSLSIARSTTNAVVSWPVKNIPSMLKRATDLSTPNWAVVTNSVAGAGPSNVVIQPSGPGNGFFRLKMLE